jgi:hypothetical protein
VVSVQQSPVQFMPGVFAEIHPWNFKLWGVKDPADKDKEEAFKQCEKKARAEVAAQCQRPDSPECQQLPAPTCVQTWMSVDAPRHPFGYVGSFGFAGGIMANPNSGTTQAEYFGGVSFGIQRFAILFGNHWGHYLELTNGYINGAPVASGTSPTTVSNWHEGFAFGITYRIPLR